MIYLGDHVRLRVALAGNDDFMVKRPIGEAHALAAQSAKPWRWLGRPSIAARSRGKHWCTDRSLDGGSKMQQT